MATYQVGVIVGSLREASINRQLANALLALFPEDVSVSIIDINELPIYNQDCDGKQPEAVAVFKQAVSEKQGIVFVTPEHNRSIPAALKNALDHGSRPYGKAVWGGKAAAILGTSPGATATAMAQQHLRNIVSALDMPTLTQPEVYIQWSDDLIDAEGQLNVRTKKFLQKWVDAYVAWLKTTAK